MPTLGDWMIEDGENFMTPAALLEKRRREQAALAKLLDNNWTPNEGAQNAAYHSLADELFYGGQAGGGKTDLLLGLAGTAHRKSLILRREFPRLRDMIERSREIYNAGNDPRVKDSYNESLHIWRLVSKRMVEFGSMQREEHKENYRGRAHDLKAWDEITEFSEAQFRFANTWNRTVIKGQRCRVVACGNPPSTKGGLWVIPYWGPWLDRLHPNPAMPGELRFFARIDDKDVEVPDATPIQHGKETIIPRSRTFIPASLDDNPYLKDSGYRSVLQNLPEPLRSQLLYGDFTAGALDDPWQVIPTEWIKLAQARWTEKKPEGVPLSAVGCDPSRGGDDKTCIAKRYRDWIDRIISHPGSAVPDGPAVVGFIVIALGNEVAPVNVDVIGIGTSVYDHGKAVIKDPKTGGQMIFGLNGSEKSIALDRSGRLTFVNKRAEWWWRLREALDPAYGATLALPPDPELLADLCAPKWWVSVRGIQVEEKKDIKSRLGRSPDKGEAVIYALADPYGGYRWVPVS